MNGSPPALRARIAVVRALTAALKATGQRERVLRVRLDRARRQRRAAGRDDPLSRPALHEMDRKLDALLDLDGGFFVEAGGNDGYTQSNTYWLERFRGWRGILVEPMPELYEQCRTERPDATVVRAALVPFDYEGDTVRMRFGDLMSTVAGAHEDPWRTRMGTVTGWRDAYEVDTPARTLTAVLDAADAPEIDLLSLDVEGFEPAVLARAGPGAPRSALDPRRGPRHRGRPPAAGGDPRRPLRVALDAVAAGPAVPPPRLTPRG